MVKSFTRPAFSRRTALLGLAAVAAVPLVARWRRPSRVTGPGDLVLYGPPAGPSIILAQAAHRGVIGHLDGRVDLKVWRSPDEMRAGLSSGTMAAVVLPTQVAANLYNRGMKIRLLNIMTNGLLYVISADHSIDGFPALRGRKLAVPFRNDMPDLVIKRLLTWHGMDPAADLTLVDTGSPVEATQMLLLGRVDAALIAEPAGTAAARLGKLIGKDIRRVIDIQAAWGEITGHAPVLPQAGLALTDTLRDAHPGLADALQLELEAAAEAVNADPEAAAAVAAEFLDFPTSVLAASIAVSKLVATRAREAREPIETMLAALADADPAVIGGRMPDDGFYL